MHFFSCRVPLKISDSNEALCMDYQIKIYKII